MCCRVVAIPELVKPPGVRCRHLRAMNERGGMCTIYNQRPKPCQTFRCAWLEGLGPENARPDLSGIMLERGTLQGFPGLSVIYGGGEDRRGALAANLDNLVEWLPAGSVAIVETATDCQIVAKDEDTLRLACEWLADATARGLIAKLGDGPLQMLEPGI